MQITFTFSRRNVSLQWIKEETRGFDLPCSPHHFNGCQNNGQHHSRSIHHSRSFITPGATSLQKQHHARKDITPGATSFQKQHYSRSKIFPTVPHPFSSPITFSIIVTPAEANTPAVNVTAAFPIKEAMTITLRFCRCSYPQHSGGTRHHGGYCQHGLRNSITQIMPVALSYIRPPCSSRLHFQYHISVVSIISEALATSAHFS